MVPLFFSCTWQKICFVWNQILGGVSYQYKFVFSVCQDLIVWQFVLSLDGVFLRFCKMLVIKKRLCQGGTSTPAFQENKCAQAAVDFKVLHENGAVYFVAGNNRRSSTFWKSFPLFGKEQGSSLDDWSINCLLEICAVPLNGGKPSNSPAVVSSSCHSLVLAQAWFSPYF